MVGGGVVAALVLALAVPADALTPPWVSTTLPTPRFDVGVYTDVACATATSCLAVGGGGGGSVSYPDDQPGISARWDGGRWTSLPLPGHGEAVDLAGVACPAVTDCLAVGVGTGTRPAVLRWDGSRWRTAAAPVLAGGGTGALNAVDCLSSVDCTAVGWQYDAVTGSQPLIAHWDGTEWSTHAVARPPASGLPTLTAVACASPTVCFAVGGGNDKQVLLTGTDQRWTVTPVPPASDGLTRGTLTGVACGGPSSCLAVGVHAVRRPAEYISAVLGWDGSTWSVLPPPDPGLPDGTTLRDVSCTGPASCEAVGRNHASDGNGPTVPFAGRWDGTTWTTSRFALPAEGDDYQVNALDCASSSCVSVGMHVLPSPGIRQTMSQVGGGVRWRVVPTPNVPVASPASFSRISCSSDSACAAIGVSAPPGHATSTRTPLLTTWDGARWVTLTVPLDGLPGDVSCSALRVCTALMTDTPSGVAATARLTGATWTTSAFAVPRGAGPPNMSALSCPDARTCFAVGSTGSSSHTSVVERWTPGRWSVVAHPVSDLSEFSDVSCTTATSCVAVGSVADSSTPPRIVPSAQRWDGVRWSRIAVPLPSDTQAGRLTAVSCVAARCVALGVAGLRLDAPVRPFVVGLDGGAWSLEPQPADGAGRLTDVSCSSGNDCTAVGADDDGLPYAQHWDGTSWTADPPPPGSAPPASVSCHPVCRAVASSAAVFSRPAASGRRAPTAGSR